MGWVRLDDGFPDHPKMLRVGDRAFRFYVVALCWSARQLTDGFIPDSFASRPKDVQELVAAGALEKADGGYQIHDYLDYNPSRGKVLADRAAARERSMNASRRSAEVRAKKQRSSGEVQPKFAETSEPPAPAPKDLEVQSQRHSPEDRANEEKPNSPFALDDHQLGLIGTLLDRYPTWATGKGALTYGGAIRLQKRHGIGTFNQALEDLVEHAGQVKRPYPWLAQVAADYAEEKA